MPRFGLIGLGVMGRNLALNARDHGGSVVGFDVDPAARAAFGAAGAGETADSVADLVARLQPPRIVMLLVPAGAAVEEQLATLRQHLAEGDIVVDAGNSHFRDTERRAALLTEARLGFVGLGVSGGEEGARRGPALMAGGDAESTERLRGMLAPLAARVGDRPCFDVFGTGGAGHFVKMVHNGIEYAVMQTLAEGAMLLRQLGRLTPKAAGRLFMDWNHGPLGSYLLEISGRILQTTDPDTGLPLVDVIVDAAEQKGTGHWAVTAAMELGVPVPCIAAAVEARALSSFGRRPEREAQPNNEVPADLAEAVHDALVGGVICAYAQGFSLLVAGRRAYGWTMDLTDVAANWQGGCIIRSQMLSGMGGPDLLSDVPFHGLLAAAEPGWRRAATMALAAGLPVPALTAALTYWDGLRMPRLWADLVQAQRDYFGAHGFRRIDRHGVFHGPWRP